jgi:Na+-translocating ferredoxin:NAD+ oxidoreductase RnfG subunit
MLKKEFVVIGLFALVLGGISSMAEETTREKIKDAGNDLKHSVKKGVNKVKDETCEMTNGKIECVAKKIKHKASNAVDESGNKAKEIKNKID